MQRYPRELAQRAAAGDLAAFEAIVESQWGRLVALARSVVGEADAEDAVQDGLLLAWRRLASLRAPEALAGWLERVVLRCCLDRARRRWRWLPMSVATEPHARSDPESKLDVERLLGGLAPRQRAVLHLTVVEGLSDSEIGALLGIRPASVRSHRRRARQRIDRLLTVPPEPRPTPLPTTAEDRRTTG